MATYPGSIVVFTTKYDNVDTVLAADPNTIQAEVAAIESTLGTNPNISGTSGGTYIPTPSYSHANVGARISNVEYGLVSISTGYVSKAGGSIITTSATSVKGLVITGAASQTANLQEWRTNSGLGAYVDKDANLVNPKSDADLNNLFVLSVVFG